MSPLRVGVVCPYDLTVPGGVQQITIELADELRRQGDEVVLLGAGKESGPESALEENTLLMGWPVRARANGSVAPLTMSLSRRRVRRALAEVDVLHVHEPLIPTLGWLALSVGKPTVATFHADPPGWARSIYRITPFVGRSLRRARLTAVSETAAAAIPATWGPVRVIPNAIDTASYALPVGRVIRRVCFLGRDEPRKGLDLLLRAWPAIRERVPEAELQVVGVSRPDPGPGIEYKGRVSSPDKKRILATSLVYVAPNTGGESFGIVIAEAMAAGCAVVSSDLPAFRAVLGDTGRLAPVGDTNRLADEVSDLLSDPDEALSLGRAAQHRARMFDWGVVTAAYRRAYEEALS